LCTHKPLGVWTGPQREKARPAGGGREPNGPGESGGEGRMVETEKPPVRVGSKLEEQVHEQHERAHYQHKGHEFDMRFHPRYLHFYPPVHLLHLRLA
jgi:hypothetical protein